MFRVIRFLSVLLLLGPLSEVAAAAKDPIRELVFLGKAVDMETKQLLYIEKHQMQLDENQNYVRGKVDYMTPEGVPFASKQLNFETSAIAPSVFFSDARTDKKVVIENRNNRTSLSVTRQGVPIVEKSLQLSDKAVVDAGFDRFIHRHWAQIQAGEAIAFPFLAHTRGILFDFEVVKDSERDDTIVMQVRPSNMFLRWLVDPIELVYEKVSRRLISYAGVTNIQKVDDGKPSDDFYVAEIRYEYAATN